MYPTKVKHSISNVAGYHPGKGPYANWKANNQENHKTRKWLSMLVGPGNDRISFCVLNCTIVD